MANVDFKSVFDKLKEVIASLAMSTVKNYKNEAKADALKLVEDMKENLQTWTLKLADGSLSQKDFEFLVLAQKELIEMNALKQAGLALIEMDKFKDSVLKLIVNTVISLI